MTADGDRDGMSDCWELSCGLSPDDPQDAAQDVDQDGLTNLEEFEAGTHPFEADTDNDGLSDGDEKVYWTQHFGTWITDYDSDGEENNLLDPDADGDGFFDGEEATSGTNPADPMDFPSPVSVPALSPGLLIIALGLLTATGWFYGNKRKRFCT